MRRLQRRINLRKMSLSNVTIVRQQGLAKTSRRNDGISGLIADAVAIDDKITIGTPMILTSLAEAESKGVTKAYDLANKVMLWHHIRDFYSMAPKGTTLYVMPVAKQTPMATVLATSDGAAAQLLNYAKGSIRQLALSSMSEDFANLATNVAAAQALYTWAAQRNKSVQILLEGREFVEDYSTAVSLREMSANRVSVVISQDPQVAVEDAAYAGYAQVGLLLGSVAAVPVSRDIARVRNGSLPLSSVGVSNGKNVNLAGYYDDDQLSAIDDKGYIFARTFDGLSGFYWSADYTAVAPTDDCDSIRMGRTLDKAADLARLKALEYLRDDVEIDSTTGNIAIEVVRNIESDIETSVLTQMAEEISGVECSIDPEQSLWDSASPLIAELAIVARGVIYRMQINVYYTNSLSND